MIFLSHLIVKTVTFSHSWTKKELNIIYNKKFIVHINHTISAIGKESLHIFVSQKLSQFLHVTDDFVTTALTSSSNNKLMTSNSL